MFISRGWKVRSNDGEFREDKRESVHVDCGADGLEVIATGNVKQSHDHTPMIISYSCSTLMQKYYLINKYF